MMVEGDVSVTISVITNAFSFLNKENSGRERARHETGFRRRTDCIIATKIN
jgi:hypothetical protein